MLSLPRCLAVHLSSHYRRSLHTTMSNRSSNHQLPTPNELSDFLQTFIPLKPKEARDVDWYWHGPSPPKLFDPSYFNQHSSPVTNFVLGVVPSEHLYTRLNDISRSCRRFRCWQQEEGAERPPPMGAKGIVGFLHRPFDLDHRRVARGALIHASHKSFDELLTTGWNLHLARALGASEDEQSGPFAMTGYKNDPDRRIGLIGSLQTSRSLKEFITKIRQEFDDTTEIYLGDQKTVYDEEEKPRTVSVATTEIPDRDVKVIALMNASSPEVIDRIVEMCVENKLIAGTQEADKIVMVTGAPRELGLQKAKELKLPVICVGHRPCEVWGIKFLAKQAKTRWPDLQVDEILDDEESKGDSANGQKQSDESIPGAHKRGPQQQSQPRQTRERPSHHPARQDQNHNQTNGQARHHQNHQATNEQKPRTYANATS